MKTEAIAKVINEWDPMGLFSAGCPEDEYEYEIGELQNSVLKEDSEEVIAEKIYATFKKQFGDILLTVQLRVVKKQRSN